MLLLIIVFAILAFCLSTALNMALVWIAVTILGMFFNIPELSFLQYMGIGIVLTVLFPNAVRIQIR